MRTMALPSLASFLASSGGVTRGSRSLWAISFQRSSLARFSSDVEMTAMIIGLLGRFADGEEFHLVAFPGRQLLEIGR